jgi:hypothetical protein
MKPLTICLAAILAIGTPTASAWQDDEAAPDVLPPPLEGPRLEQEEPFDPAPELEEIIPDERFDPAPEREDDRLLDEQRQLLDEQRQLERQRQVRWHAGYWWFQARDGRWLVYVDGRWQEFHPLHMRDDPYRPGYPAAARYRATWPEPYAYDGYYGDPAFGDGYYGPGYHGDPALIGAEIGFGIGARVGGWRGAMIGETIGGAIGAGISR